MPTSVTIAAVTSTRALNTVTYTTVGAYTPKTTVRPQMYGSDMYFMAQPRPVAPAAPPSAASTEADGGCVSAIDRLFDWLSAPFSR